MSDVAFMILTQKLMLSHCKINGSEERWKQLHSIFEKHTIKSFLLPPSPPPDLNNLCASQVVAYDTKVRTLQYTKQKKLTNKYAKVNGCLCCMIDYGKDISLLGLEHHF